MRHKQQTERVSFYVPVAELIDQASPATHMSCDWLTDPLGLGIQVFPVRTYEILRELRNGNPSR